MNTRSFLKSLLVAAVAPHVLIPKLPDGYRWKGRLVVPFVEFVTDEETWERLEIHLLEDISDTAGFTEKIEYRTDCGRGMMRRLYERDHLGFWKPA